MSIDKPQAPSASSPNPVSHHKTTPAQRKQIELCHTARAAERTGHLDSAISGFREAALLDTTNPTPLMYLGFALQQANQLERASQVYSLAADLDPRTTQAWRKPGLDEEIRVRSKALDQAIRHHSSALHAAAMQQYQQRHPDADIQRIREAIWCQTHTVPFSYKTPRQRPHLFYVPDLAPVAAFDAADLSWRTTLEGAAEEIRAEFSALAVRHAEAEMPYLNVSLKLGEGWQSLVGQLNWGSFFLYQNGQVNETLKPLIPRTLDILRQIDTLTIAGTPREVVFSILKGNQHIPPHYGVANTDATVHLPLIAPPDSGIRVADTTHLWAEGEMFAFDDSFEHESWNRSERLRVNLLFEAWHPDLSEQERGAVAQSFEMRDIWNRSRRI